MGATTSFEARVLRDVEVKLGPDHGTIFKEAPLEDATCGEPCARVVGHMPGSRLAGVLIQGDIVTHCDDEPVRSSDQLNSWMSGALPVDDRAPDVEAGGLELSEMTRYPLEGQRRVLKLSRVRCYHVQLTKQHVSSTRGDHGFGLQIGTPRNAARTPWAGQPTFVLKVHPTGAAAASGLLARGARLDALDTKDVMSPSHLAHALKEVPVDGVISLFANYGYTFEDVDEMVGICDI